MFETVAYESRQRLPGTAVLAASLAAFAGMVIAITPGVIGEVDMDAILAQLPPGLVESLGLGELGTAEGFIALELYQFVWIVGLGAYLAYTAASTIAGDVETGRLDTVLAAPIGRTRLLLEKYLALLTPIAVVNVVVFTVIYAGAIYIDEPIAATDLAMVHLLSVPYLLACAAVGMLASVLAPRRLVAEGVAAGAIVGTFLLQTIVVGADVEWLGAIAPMRYYDPLTILTESHYDLAGAAILLAAAAALIVAASIAFRERDLT